MAPRRRPRPALRPSDIDPAAGDDGSRPTASQFENRLLNKLAGFYAAALVRLADLGHGEEASLDALLHSGTCYGTLSDPVSNIVASACAYFSDPGYAIGKAGGFADLRRLAEYSLAGLVCLVQSSRPTLTRRDAFSCLMSSGLNLEGAIIIASRKGDSSPAPVPAEVEELPPAPAPVPAEVEAAGGRGCTAWIDA